jgi:nucleoside-diphosphate-sugar epimerase
LASFPTSSQLSFFSRAGHLIMSLVLVTGISGYLASYLVNELLIAGYRVRGTVRGGKLALVREGYATSPYKDRLEIVQVEDIVDGDFTEALKGLFPLRSIRRSCIDSTAFVLRRSCCDTHRFASLQRDCSRRNYRTPSPLLYVSTCLNDLRCLQIAEKGTMNVVKQAEKAGIKKIVFTSSMSTALNPDGQWSSESKSLSNKFY